MAVVVSDTSPIRALDFLKSLHLLQRLFSEVVVPPAVRDELAIPRKRFRAIEVTEIPGAVVRSPVDISAVKQLERELQSGESQAIILARELGAQLLIDEMDGRRIARQLG